jgi:hypothetical protein
MEVLGVIAVLVGLFVAGTLLMRLFQAGVREMDRWPGLANRRLREQQRLAGSEGFLTNGQEFAGSEDSG